MAIDEVLVCAPERARRLVENLRLAHPRALAERLAKLYGETADVRVKSRAVWAIGEPGGECGIDFLLACTRSAEPNIRRLAASALGKVVGPAKAAAARIPAALVEARKALAALANDPAPQVRQDAARALAELRKRGIQ